ncbi:putative cullulin 3 [Xylariomycetidae sp. FL0641]|nr:putative cullulin 3 [Xylariomycetidae sp. FL0641]
MITGRGGASGRGRGVIRPPRRQTGQSAVSEFDQFWEKLRNAMKSIHEKRADELQFEQLYRWAYKIVVKRLGQQLYDRVKEFEEQWFADTVLPPIMALVTKNLISVTLDENPGTSLVERRAVGERFLRGLRASWEDHNISMNMIADILMYLDRGFAEDRGRPSIYTATLGLFRDHLLRVNIATNDSENGQSNHQVFDILNATIIDQVNMEREGDVIDRTLLRSCVYMLESLCETDQGTDHERLYLTTFEPAYIRASHAFYKSECDRLLREGDASAWLRYTQRRLAEETERCHTTVSPLSLQSIALVLDHELVSSHLEEFLQLEGSGIRAMIDNDRLEDLKILYTLVSRVDQKKAALHNALSVRVTELGIEIEKNLKNTDFSIAQQAEEEPTDKAEKPKAKALTASAQQTAAAIKWVDDVLILKDKFDRLSTNCFSNDVAVSSAISVSFAGVVNSFDRSSEYISLFIDDNLKRGIKGKTEAEVDVVLDKAITLLRFVKEKDSFEQYYQKHLARRLLHAKSESQEVEQEMISRMKRELGNGFTQKFEGMFRDMKTSQETTEEYRNHVRALDEEGKKQIDLSISVLAGNNWPKEVMGRHSGLADGSRPKATFPPEIERLQHSFFGFYSKERNGRVLTWVASAGSADIRCIFPKIPGKTSGPLSKERRYEVNVSTFGMIVLLLFNDIAEDTWLAFEDIQAATNISEPDLVNTLTSLSSIKQFRVLQKESQSKAAAKPGDKFTFNREFVSKAIKIKIPSVNAANKVETDEERKETKEKNLETRRHVTDAAIVRIMKQRKELGHTQLVNEVIQVLAGRFRPEVSLIKGQIEALLSREYIERAEFDDGSPAYRYVA